MNWRDGEYQPKQKRADVKKNRILDASLQLFSTQGYHGTTTKAIAAKAGVATGSFYRYFRNKNAAFLAVCQRLSAELGGWVFEYGKRMREEGHKEKAVLISIVRQVMAAHHSNRDFHREVLAMTMLDTDVAAWAEKQEEKILDDLLEFLEPMRHNYRVKDLEAATELIYYTIEEVAHQSVLSDTPVGGGRLSSALQDMLLKYLFG